MVYFGEIFPHSGANFLPYCAFWCKFYTGPVHLAETGDILYSLVSVGIGARNTALTSFYSIVGLLYYCFTVFWKSGLLQFTLKTMKHS